MGTELGTVRPIPSTDTLRLAVEFIEANAHFELAVGDVADAASVTVRALQLSFRRNLDTTPMAYLRAVRLAHARAQLVECERGGTSVSEVAARWGFFNAGRFSAAYRDTYGELPRETLRVEQ